MGEYNSRGIYIPDTGESGWDPEMNANLEWLSSTVHNVKAFGAMGDGSTDDTAAIQAAIDEATTTIYTSARGGIVFLPKGVYIINDTIDVKNYVRLMGENENAVRIKAGGSFPDGETMITMGPLGSGNGDVYGVTLENLRIDCDQVDDVIGIAMNDCNEHCGIFNVEVRNFDGGALDVTASGHCTIERFACNGFATASLSNSNACVYLHANVGPIWMGRLGNISSGWTTAPSGSAGILIQGTNFLIQGAHFEHVEDGIHVDTGFGGVIMMVNAHTTVTNAVHLASGHANTVPCLWISDGGGTNAIKDDDNGGATVNNIAYFYPWT